MQYSDDQNNPNRKNGGRKKPLGGSAAFGGILLTMGLLLHSGKLLDMMKQSNFMFYIAAVCIGIVFVSTLVFGILCRLAPGLRRIFAAMDFLIGAGMTVGAFFAIYNAIQAMGGTVV